MSREKFLYALLTQRMYDPKKWSRETMKDKLNMKKKSSN